MRSKQGVLAGGALVAVVIGVIVALTVAGRGEERPAESHDAAVAVAEEYLRAFAAADVRGLCETYTAASQQEAFATYGVSDCAAYAKAHMADEESGYSVTRRMEAEFEVGEATGDDRRVEVAFTGDVEYTGDDPAAIEYYEEHPTVSGDVVVVREGDAWKVDAAATQDSF